MLPRLTAAPPLHVQKWKKKSVHELQPTARSHVDANLAVDARDDQTKGWERAEMGDPWPAAWCRMNREA